MPAAWVDEVFEAHRQRQYPRELLFSTVVELMSLVSLGLRPSLHAAARQMDNLPVSERDGPVRQGQPYRARVAAGVGARDWVARPACPAGNYALSMATTCRPRKSGSSLCVANAPPPCRGIRWWSTIPTWIRSSTCRPARIPMKASAPVS